MSSAHIEEHITAYIDGVLPVNTHEKVKSHLTFCNGCRRHLTEIRENIFSLNKTPVVTPPDDLKERILASLDEKPVFENEKTNRRVATRSPLRFAPWILIPIVVFAAFIGYRLIPTQSKPASPAIKREPPVFTQIEPEVTPTRAPSVAVEAAPVILAPSVRILEVATKKATSPAPVVESKPLAVRVEPNESPSEKATSNSVWSGPVSQIRKAREQLVADQASWEALWSEHMDRDSKKEPPPSVDFERNEVVALFAGRVSGGPGVLEIIKLDSTEWNAKPARLVHYQVNTSTTIDRNLAGRYPFLFKVVPRIRGRTFFRRNR